MWSLFQAIIAVFLIYVLMYVPQFFEVVIERLRYRAPEPAATTGATDDGSDGDAEDA